MTYASTVPSSPPTLLCCLCWNTCVRLWRKARALPSLKGYPSKPIGGLLRHLVPWRDRCSPGAKASNERSRNAMACARMDACRDGMDG